MFYPLFSKIFSYLRPKKNNLCTIFDHIYVVNLKRCADRKAHTMREFARVGIKEYEFTEAVDKDDPLVLEWMQSGPVAEFAPCFRCGKNRCDCANNALTSQHIKHRFTNELAATMYLAWNKLINKLQAETCEQVRQFCQQYGYTL